MSRIIFHYIKFKNFMSYGNYDSIMELDEHKLTLIQGSNGAGKTTSLLALSYNLFGKTFNKALKASLINKKNKKGLLTECSFSIGGDKYVVVRGEKPSIFRVEKNGKELEVEGDSREFQKRFEDEVLQFDLKTFTRLICLGYDYIRFFELSAPERREFIESVLDLETLSNMLKKVKELQKNDSDSLTKYGLMLNGKKSNKEIYEKQLETLSQSNDQLIKDYEDKIKTLTDENNNLHNIIVNSNHEIEEYNIERNDILNEIKENNDKNLKIRDEVTKIKNFMDNNNKMIDFLSNHDDCPTCKQHIDTNFKNEHIKSLETQNNSYKSKMDEYKGIYDSNKIVLDNNQKLLDDINSKISNKNNEIIANKTSFKNNDITINETNKLLLDAKNNNNIDSLKRDIQETLNDINNFDEIIKKLTLRLDVYKTTTDILSENGVKKAIINNYIDIINQKVNEYLEDYNCTFDFEMDSEFNETINLDFHDDVKYENLSAGQKQRLDLSIFLAFREIAQLRSKVSANVLLLDEILDQNLDIDGVVDTLKILQKQNINILAISHNDTVKEMVDNVLTIKKEKYGFSRIIK